MNFYAEDVSRLSARNIKRDVLHQLKHRADLRNPDDSVRTQMRVHRESWNSFSEGWLSSHSDARFVGSFSGYG